MSLPFGIQVTRATTRAMSEQMDDLQKTLKSMGYSVVTGQEAAFRHDEIVTLDEFIKNPLTSVPDKLDAIDSLLFRNLQWGMGRTDRFWAYVYNVWLEGYHEVWLPALSACMPPVYWKFDVGYEMKRRDMKGKEVTVQKRGRFDAETVLFLQLTPDTYPKVGVPVPVKIAKGRHPLPTDVQEDYLQSEKELMDFGMSYAMQWGKMLMSYIQHPEHINKSTVYVLQGAQQQGDKRVVPTSSLEMAPKPDQSRTERISTA